MYDSAKSDNTQAEIYLFVRITVALFILQVVKIKILVSFLHSIRSTGFQKKLKKKKNSYQKATTQHYYYYYYKSHCVSEQLCFFLTTSFISLSVLNITVAVYFLLFFFCQQLSLAYSHMWPIE